MNEPLALFDHRLKRAAEAFGVKKRETRPATPFQLPVKTNPGPRTRSSLHLQFEIGSDLLPLPPLIPTFTRRVHRVTEPFILACICSISKAGLLT